MFQQLSEILPKDVKRDREDQGVDICDLWHKYANQVFLSKIMSSHEAISFRDGALVISVSNTMFLDEIKARSWGIVRKINEELKMKNKEVKEVKYR